ncbi:ATP synthase F0 subunit B [Candidatus Berkelbacteria bacterium RIFCSPHIGHO2_12_FULL_36_9]|uniref:ATP synthase subunit b n=1 Tax=Candidatus Berkelbacteria bacterium RIFCSPHIGHO2_12_FULL_36_9 TaxID=1797469 RepID=A0A1F5EHJ8_9BACT|nr:MAG: ATP synthase F0 subunit B [Candidatus Berkelbacteria bacterium RIFCSPHIGHO2_12_FULL_36_9]
MESIGIDFKTLFVQIINFLLLFLILRWLLYRPILNILDERKKKIEDSLALAEKTKKESEELDQKTRATIEDTKKEALGILEEAKKQGEKTKNELLAQTNRDADILMKKTEERIVQQKEEMKRELRKETVNLTIAVAEKLLQKEINEETQTKLIDDAIKGIK